MNSAPETRSVWLAAIALASVFAVGSACGVLADRVVFLGDAGVFHEERHLVRDPLLEANLSDEQRMKMDAIFERHRAEVESVMHDTEPKMRALADRMDREVDAILTPKQREQLKAARPRPYLLRTGPGAPAGAGVPMPGIQGGAHIIQGYALPPPSSSTFGTAPHWVQPLESGEPPPP